MGVAPPGWAYVVPQNLPYQGQGWQKGGIARLVASRPV